MEATPYSIGVSRETRGPSTEKISDAYNYLRTMKRAFASQDSKPSQAVREALVFFLTHEPIDCTRFLLFALTVLEEAPVQFARLYGAFWSTYGAISAEVLNRYEQTHVIIRPPEITTRFASKFRSEETPWDIREKIITGFTEVATRTTRRDGAFWETAETFLEYCQKGLQKGSNIDISVVGHSARALINFWHDLSGKFGTNDDVRQHLAKAAVPLLDLILKTQLTWNVGFHRWMVALFNLKLPVADPLQNQPVPRHGVVQESLDVAAAKIAELSRDKDHPLYASLRGVLDDFVPYLHGLSPCGERAGCHDPHAQAVFRSGSEKIMETKVRIADVCLRTCRGFRIEADGLSLRGYYDADKGLIGELDGRRIRVVDALLEGRDNPITLDSVDLMIAYSVEEPDGLTSGKVTVPAKILRAWPINATQSGWALLAPQSVELPDSWFSYVKALRPLTRETRGK